jgi:hypothetical protein
MTLENIWARILELFVSLAVGGAIGAGIGLALGLAMAYGAVVYGWKT